MSRAKNGSAIIFNFEDFQEFKKYKKRDGSQADVNRLLSVFRELNINIDDDRVHKNMAYNSMREKLKDCKCMCVIFCLKVVHSIIAKKKTLLTHISYLFLSYQIKMRKPNRSIQP